MTRRTRPRRGARRRRPETDRPRAAAPPPARARGPLSRRRFLGLIAAATALPSAALAATTTSGTIGPRRPSGRPRAGSPPPATAATSRAASPGEIDAQKRSLAKMLETIRSFPLEAGSNPAFVFTPLKPRRRR